MVNNGAISLARKEFAMAKDITLTTSRASLCALGEYLKRHCFFAPLREQVQIPQKTVRYRPIDKLLDGLLGILCGAKTISQSNGTIRLDPAVQRACGRTGCAEQSTMARTLQACTAETVAQFDRVSWYYLKRYGQTPHHRFAERLLWVDVDVTPMPIGSKAEAVSGPGWGATAARRGGKCCGAPPATTETCSRRHCCGAQPASRSRGRGR